jgi:hypothetical protein
MRTVKDLVLLPTDEDVFIKFHQDKIPAFSYGSQWNKVARPEVKIGASFAKLNHIYRCMVGYFELNFTSSDGTFSLIFPEDFPIELITGGKEVDAFVSNKKKKIIRDLKSYLGHNHHSSLSVDVFFISGDGNARRRAEFIPSGFSGRNPNPRPYGEYCVSNEGFAAHLSTSWENCLAWPIDCIREGLQQLHKKAKDKECSISLSSVVKTEGGTLEEKRSRLEISNLYGLSPKPDEYHLVGGSRIGAKKPLNQKQVNNITKALDAIVGVLCVSLAQGIDQPLMRTLSCLPGDYTFYNGKYEYAGLSNFWLSHPFIANMVADIFRKVFQIGYHDVLEIWKTSHEETISCMIDCDVPLAQKIMVKNKDLLMKIFNAAWGNYNVCDFSQDYLGYQSHFSSNDRDEKIFSIFHNGILSVIKDPLNLDSNWNLEKEWVQHSDGLGKNVSNAMFSLLNDNSYRL